MEWVILKTLDDRANAELLSERLNSENMPNKIDYGSLEVGLEGFRLYVPGSLLGRARQLIADTDYTDEELNYLSTGKSSEND